MKFKNYIEAESGIKDTSTSPGTAGQVLSSTVTGTSWIDPDTLVSAASKLVVIACKNVSGTPILKGTPVYQSGTVGATDVIEVEPADATISTGHLPAIGILQTTLNNNGVGNVVITGEFLSYRTADIPTDRPGGDPFTGDTVYLAAGGGLTCIKPTGAGNAIQNVGLMGKVSNGNSGSITVSSIMRANDVPNLPTGKIWVGDGNTIVSDVVYLDETNERMGIGTTSPGAKLEVNGTIDVNGNGDRVFVADGSDGTFSLGDLDGLSNEAQIVGDADTIKINNGGSTTLTSNFNNRIGIGTTSPGSKLQVDGEIDANGGDGYKIDGRPWANWSSDLLTLGDWDGEGYATRIMGSNSSEVMRVTGTNVGIGTTSPQEKLHVQNYTTGESHQAMFKGGAVTVGDYSYISLNNGYSAEYNKEVRLAAVSEQSNSNKTGFAILTSPDGNGASGHERLRVTADGNVGIGTTSPDSKLEIEDSGTLGVNKDVLSITSKIPSSATINTTVGMNFNLQQSSNAAIPYGAIRVGEHLGTGNIKGSMRFMVQNYSGGFSLEEKMRIESDGNVGIGTTNAQAKLHVANGTLRTWTPTTGTSAIFESTASNRNFLTITAANESEIWFGDAAVQARGRVRYENNNNAMELWTNGSPRININSTGNVGIGTTSPSDKLEVAAANSQLRLRDTDDNNFAQFSYSSGKLVVRNNSTTTTVNQFTLDSAGKMGIGTTSPNRLLTVQTTGTGSYLALNSSSNNTTIGSDINGAFLVYDDTASTYRMVIKPTTGNVGIGTTSPRAKLDVNGGIKLANDTSFATSSNVGTFRYRTSGNNSYVDMCMQTGASSYAWVNIVTNSW